LPNGFGVPFGEGMSLYFKQQHQFVKSLSSNVCDRIVVRVSPADYRYYSCGQREQLESLMLNLRFDKNKSIIDSLLKSRLVILDNIQTVFFEVIAYGIPVIVFHDESIWEFNREFDAICEEMKKVGMLHVSPKSAAEFLSKNFDSIEVWWNSSAVQELLESIRCTYARTSDHPERKLIEELNKALNTKNLA
jgi:putative transferase (TIGR04331 family)